MSPSDGIAAFPRRLPQQLVTQFHLVCGAGEQQLTQVFDGVLSRPRRLNSWNGDGNMACHAKSGPACSLHYILIADMR
ncbi:MAG: hypothetical protein H7062_24110 [Candidatus Saccharimonas sp.]|nr:hypothetical protein [Planctomycetaceae bacterium]